MGLIASLALLLVALLGGYLAVIRLPPYLTAALFPLAALLLTPIWLANAQAHDWNWFVLAKNYSMVLSCTWIALGRAGLLSGTVFGWGVVLLLAANIFEAVAVDSYGANQVAGLLLIAAMPGPGEARIRNDHLAQRTSWLWIAAYTVWNASFAYSNWTSGVFGKGVALLAAPLILSAVAGPHRWLQHRCYTLSLFFLVYATFPGVLGLPMATHHWHEPRVALVLQGLGVLGGLVAFAERLSHAAPFASRIGKLNSMFGRM